MDPLDSHLLRVLNLRVALIRLHIHHNDVGKFSGLVLFARRCVTEFFIHDERVGNGSMTAFYT